MDEEIISSIRTLLIDLIDQILQRPISNILFEDEQRYPFDSLKSKLESKSSMTLNEFYSPIQSFFSNAKVKDGKYVSGSAIVLENFFEKKFNTIISLNSYHFKDVFVAAAKDAFPDVAIQYQKPDDKDLNDDINTSHIQQNTEIEKQNELNANEKQQDLTTEKENQSDKS